MIIYQRFLYGYFKFYNNFFLIKYLLNIGQLFIIDFFFKSDSNLKKNKTSSNYYVLFKSNKSTKILDKK